MDTKKSTRLLPIILAMIVLVLACSIPGQNQIPAATMPACSADRDHGGG